jgi:hypothetical protein
MLCALLLLAAQQATPVLPPLTPERRSRFQPWRDNYVQLLSWRADLPKRASAASVVATASSKPSFSFPFATY